MRRSDPQFRLRRLRRRRFPRCLIGRSNQRSVFGEQGGITGSLNRAGCDFLGELGNYFIHKQFHLRKILKVLEVRDDQIKTHLTQFVEFLAFRCSPQLTRLSRFQAGWFISRFANQML